MQNVSIDLPITDKKLIEVILLGLEILKYRFKLKEHNNKKIL